MADRLVTVASFDDPVLAALAKNHLEEDGIRVVLLDESTVATTWILSNALGGVKLQVPVGSLERAEMLLARLPGTDHDEEEALPETALAVPHVAETLQARQQEIAEDRRAEQIDQAPANQNADRLFRAVVMGLLFPPLQIYALFVLFSVFSAHDEVSPDRRWKVWASMGVLSVCFCFVPYVCLFPRLPSL